MREKIFIPGLLIFIFSCTKDKKAELNPYPGCFASLESSAYTPYCSHGSLFAAVLLDQHRLLEINLVESALRPKRTCISYNIAADTTNIRIFYYTFGNDPDSMYFGFCTDVAYPDSMFGYKIKWRAMTGTLTLSVSREFNPGQSCEPFKACIQLHNVIFRKENSTQDTLIPDFIMKDVPVGYCLG